MRLVLCDDITTTTTAVVNSCFNNSNNNLQQQNSENVGLQQQPTFRQHPMPGTSSTGAGLQHETDFLSLQRGLGCKRPDFNINPNFHGPSSLVNFSTMPTPGLLSNFLLLNPLNPDFKRMYFSMLPKVVAETLDSGSTSIDDCKQILNIFASNPQLSWEERQIVENLIVQVEEVRRLKTFVKPRTNSTHWSVAGSASMSPNMYHKNRRSTTIMNGDDVFSRMKTFRCDSMDESVASGHYNTLQHQYHAHQKSSFMEPHSGMKDVPSWLKSLRLHKYSSLFAQMSYEEMLQITEEKLEQKGVTVGARRKIVLSIQKLKERVSYLKQLEKDLIDVSRVPTTLNELRLMIVTPIKPKKVDQAENEDIPVFFTRALVRACSYLLSSPFAPNGSIDDECFSIAIHTIDRCLNHEAFMPLQKKRLVSLKQEMKRVWAPHHHHHHAHMNSSGMGAPPPHRRFSLPPHSAHQALTGALPFAAPPQSNGASAMNPMGVPASLNPKCFGALNGPYIPHNMGQGLKPKMPPPTITNAGAPNLDMMPPLINLFNQHCSLQNTIRQGLQRTSSAPVWNRPTLPPLNNKNSNTNVLLTSSTSASTSSSCCSSTSSGQLTPPSVVSSGVLSNASPLDSPVQKSAQAATTSATSGAYQEVTVASVTAAYSPWSSFYPGGGLQRAAWGCGFENGAEPAAAVLLNRPDRKQLVTDLLPSLAAKGNGSSPLSMKNFAAAPRASSSFTEYSIDQLCRSMMDAIDC